MEEPGADNPRAKGRIERGFYAERQARRRETKLALNRLYGQILRGICAYRECALGIKRAHTPEERQERLAEMKTELNRLFSEASKRILAYREYAARIHRTSTAAEKAAVSLYERVDKHTRKVKGEIDATRQLYQLGSDELVNVKFRKPVAACIGRIEGELDAMRAALEIKADSEA